jgi:hypothetical protein
VKNFIIVLLSVLIFCGCSITPRYHSFGYNVEWKTANHRSTIQTRPKQSSQPVNLGADVTHFGAFEFNIVQSIHPAFDTISSPSDSVEPVVVKKQTVDPEMRRVNNRIAVTNFLMLADAVSTPLLIRKNRDTASEGFIIYTLLIAPLIFLLLLFRRIALGTKRRRLERKNAIHGQGNQTQSSYTAEKNVRIENQDPGPTVVRDGHKSANWGLFLVLLGIAAVAVGGTFFITPIGYVLSIIGKQKAEKGSKYYKRAKAGTILGFLTILLDLFVLFLLFLYVF